MIHLGGSALAHDSLAELVCDIGDLRPHIENPRNGDVEVIAESITVNGLYRPVYAQRSTGMVLAGNHTYAAAMSLGATSLPVVWLDVDDTSAKRILLADNRTAELGNYDTGLLLSLLEDVEALDEELRLHGTGWTPMDIDRLLREGEREQERDFEVSVERLQAPATASSGIGHVTVYFQSRAHRDEFFDLIGRTPAERLYWPQQWSDSTE